MREPFRVERPELELDDVTLARAELERLATATGGRYLTPQEAVELARLIPDAGETVTDPGNPEPLWSRGWLLALVIAALAGEWALRKAMGAM